ncbi:hypothetical protein HHI36_014416 [Cryptolaemus montrouzieri]|uniref:Reverse transcriptase domain-containing protein n=1 Tax=Cryptolaemus montrouzieri TaxID=559131 RepID=A0ABD2N3R5_9CUCU
MYADDTTVAFSEDNDTLLIEEIENTITHLDNRFKDNNLTMNKGKTHIVKLLFRTEDATDETIACNSLVVAPKKGVKLLRVQVDSRLDWRGHVGFVASVLSRCSYALAILSRTVGVSASLVYYYAK